MSVRAIYRVADVWIKIYSAWHRAVSMVGIKQKYISHILPTDK